MNGTLAVIGLLLALPLGLPAQAVIHTRVFQVEHERAFTQGGADSGRMDLSTAAVTFQPYGKAQLGTSADVYTINAYGAPVCVQDSVDHTKDDCTSHIAFSASVQTNVIDAVETQLSALREYLFSRKGAPIALTLPFVPLTQFCPLHACLFQRYTSKRGTVRQSWWSYEPYLSLRGLPTTDATGKGTAAGMVGAGATVEWNLEFDATRTTSAGESRYPGTLTISLSPSGVVPIGSDLRTLVFAGTNPTTAIGGLDYRLSFSLAGDKPVSLSLNGTWGAHGFGGVESSAGLSLSKALSIH